MKIDRSGIRFDRRRGAGAQMYECTLLMRSDFTVSSASEFYYDFVGKNSMLPFTDLIDPEDAGILR
ncbi:MAG: hypothetical protein K6C95_00440, partial [Lachnospiraceae bacterium]|nr:hypothetical protein [Lachnospiraceae bacterium]